jgi:His/Glu/Gln/Arg/opine family amino acid ABC transporter permease subunit
VIESLQAIFTPRTLAALWRGTQATIFLTLLSGSIGLLLGLLAALGRMAPARAARLVAGAYIEFFRGTPLLVQLFIIYFGLPALPAVEPIPAFWAAVLGLSLYVGAYYAEIIRGAFNAIPKGQEEAARTLGLRVTQTYQYVLIPQAIRNAVPALGNQFISLIKDSTLASVITVTELLLAGRNVVSRTFQPFPVYIAIACIYLVLSNLAAFAVNAIEDYYNRPYQG